MGDRAQVMIKDGNTPPVYLYTHWNGTELPATVASALERGQGRWGDTEYLTRIIFNEMTSGRELEETGFGIGTYEHGDLGYPPIVVDDRAETVTHKGETLSYREFVAAYKA